MCNSGYLRDDLSRHTPRIERHIAEVFHHQSIHTAGGKGIGIAKGRFPDCREISAEARGAGQRLQVDHANDWFADRRPGRDAKQRR